MKQTLFYIPTEIFGVPLFGIGLLFWVIMAFVIWRLIRALFITKSNEDFWSDGTIGLVAVILVAWIAPALGHGRGLPVRGYGVFLMLAIVFSTLVVVFRAKKRWNIPPEVILSICVVQVIFGLLGARLFYVSEYWSDFLVRDPDGNLRLAATLVEILNLTQGGLVVFGSIIGGIVATLVYLKKKGLPLWGTMDLFAPALMLGIAIGRFGCFMNGCCFGAVCDAIPPGVVFPIASPAHLHQMENGEVSLGGFRLVTPDDAKTEETPSLFSIKKKDHGLLAAAGGGPIFVDSVEKESNPANAGLTAGMRILRVGALYPSHGEPTTAEIKAAPMVTPVGPRGLLTFLYDCQFMTAMPVIVMDVAVKSAGAETEASSGTGTEAISDKGVNAGSEKGTDTASKPASEKFKRIAFRPGPFEVRPVHPTQLYSAVSAFVLFLILMGLGRVFRRDGLLFAAMLILYSANRFCLEMIRTDESSFLGTGLSVSQCVSLLTILAAVGLLACLLRRTGPPAYEGKFPLTEKG